MGNQRIHEGILFLDQNERYCIYEPDRSLSQLITLTSGIIVEFLLESGKWIVGRIEGDGKRYWCFTRDGGKFELACGMVVRYLEPYWPPDSRQPLPLLDEE